MDYGYLYDTGTLQSQLSELHRRNSRCELIAELIIAPTGAREGKEGKERIKFVLWLFSFRLCHLLLTLLRKAWCEDARR